MLFVTARNKYFGKNYYESFIHFLFPSIYVIVQAQKCWFLNMQYFSDINFLKIKLFVSMTLTKVHARKTIDISSQVKIIHYPQDMEACLNRYLKKSF